MKPHFSEYFISKIRCKVNYSLLSKTVLAYLVKNFDNLLSSHKVQALRLHAYMHYAATIAVVKNYDNYQIKSDIFLILAENIVDTH